MGSRGIVCDKFPRHAFTTSGDPTMAVTAVLAVARPNLLRYICTSDAMFC